jgi:hypothetical protein
MQDTITVTEGERAAVDGISGKALTGATVGRGDCSLSLQPRLGVACARSEPERLARVAHP